MTRESTLHQHTAPDPNSEFLDLTLLLRDLVKVVTAFTLAHTVTLTLSVLNIFRLPTHIVEPMIAASIVFFPAQSRGWTRLAVATAIVAFSIGVELGHQAVVLPLFFGLLRLA